MGDLAQWFAKFFDSRNLSAPDGRMLYAYRLSKDEYHDLQTHLKSRVAILGFTQLAESSPSFCAGFVLLASEWWHREYAGGPWKWDPITDLVSKRSEVDTGSRTTCVEKGFAFWGHRPGGSGKKFIGTVVAHGGLPLRALGQGIGNLSRILHDSLRLTVRYGWQAEQLEKAISERDLSLPESLRKEDIYRLLAKMVLTALELRKEFSLANSSDPIAVLNTRDAMWMERFPISLEEAAARPLLTDLLKEAATQKLITPTTVFSVRRSLMQASDGNFELQATASAPRHASAEQIAVALRLHEDQLPSYFSVDLVGESESWLEGRLLHGEAKSVVLTGKSRTLRGKRALDELTISVRRRATPIGDGPCTLPGGTSVPLDQPWIFAEREGAWVLASVGGARLSEQTFRLALPAGWRATSENEIERVGDLRVDGAPNMEVLTVSGSARVENENERYYIYGGQSTKLTETLIWEGKRLPWQPKRYPAFCGLPKLRQIAEDGAQSSVPGTKITWRSVSSGADLSTLSVQGLVDAIVTQGEETLTRKRMLIVDNTARIEFKSGHEINCGALTFSGFGDVHPAVLSPGVTGTSERHTNKFTLSLTASDTPPETVSVALTRRGHELIFTLPFPSTGGRFFDSTGRVIPSDEELSLRDLTGCRLRIFDQNPDSTARYSLGLSLNCSKRTSRSLDEDIPLPLAANGVTEFRLIDVYNNIQTLLSFSDDLDAKVVLSLKIGNRTQSQIVVSRYGAHLVQGEQGLLSLATTRSFHRETNLLRSVCLSAAPLLNTDGDIKALEQLVSESDLDPIWSTAMFAADHGPWLIFSVAESPITVRPLIWCPQSPALENGASNLTIAMAEQDVTQRLEGIKCALKVASGNFQDSSWDQLDYLGKTFSHLPLSALDAFRVMVSEPATAVAFALRAESDVETLCRRMASELGFIWELTSPDDWLLGVKRLKEHYTQRLPAESLATIFPMILKDRCEKLARALPSMSLMLELAATEGGCRPSDQFISLENRGRAFADQTCRDLWKGGAYQSMLRGHDDQTWPDQNFHDEVFNALQMVLPQQLKNKLEKLGHLFSTEIPNFKMSVAFLPVLCALWTTTGTPTEWWQGINQMQAIRRIRAFDPEWFMHAYLAGLRACLGFGLHARLFRHPQMPRVLPPRPQHPTTQPQKPAPGPQSPTTRPQVPTSHPPGPTTHSQRPKTNHHTKSKVILRKSHDQPLLPRPHP